MEYLWILTRGTTQQKRMPGWHTSCWHVILLSYDMVLKCGRKRCWRTRIVTQNWIPRKQLLQQKKIPIPNELALTVINQEDLKTNEDIESYIDNVSKKISILNELLNKPVNPFSIRGSPFPRLGSGVIQQPTLPPLINPSLIPRPQPQPSTDIIPRQEPNNEEPETNRQSQAELEKIKKELEDEVGEKELPLKYEELKEGDLINTELKIGDKYVKFKVPNGFEELFNFYRKYIQDLEYITGKNQIMKGVYHIPIQKYNQLIKDRD